MPTGLALHSLVIRAPQKKKKKKKALEIRFGENDR